MQHPAAYDYLCRIGEAKDWIERVLAKRIPPITELEESLRDGVTLASIARTLKPDLMFGYPSYIAVFLQFLYEVGLPKQYRFISADLHDEKNVSKVIYCIHALSWMLYYNGTLHLSIWDRVHLFQFEYHELEKMQRSLDNVRVEMPNFAGVKFLFNAKPRAEQKQRKKGKELSSDTLVEEESEIRDLRGHARGSLIRVGPEKTTQQHWSATANNKTPNAPSQPSSDFDSSIESGSIVSSATSYSDASINQLNPRGAAIAQMIRSVGSAPALIEQLIKEKKQLAKENVQL